MGASSRSLKVCKQLLHEGYLRSGSESNLLDSSTTKVNTNRQTSQRRFFQGRGPSSPVHHYIVSASLLRPRNLLSPPWSRPDPLPLDATQASETSGVGPGITTKSSTRRCRPPYSQFRTFVVGPT